MAAEQRPSRYYVEYTDQQKWEALHRVGYCPQDPTRFRSFINLPTLRQARSRAKYLLSQWEFAQPAIYKRNSIKEVKPAEWDYWSSLVRDEPHV